jgi:hypothetical protein
VGQPYLEPDTDERRRLLMTTFADVGELFADTGARGIAVAADGHAIRTNLSVGVNHGAASGGDGPYPAGRGCLFAGSVTAIPA